MLFLMRHAATVWNGEGRLQGWKDSPLAPGADAQVAKFAAWLAPQQISQLYSSDLGRSVRTAEMLGHALNLKPVANAGLRECSYGECEGLTDAEIEQRFPGIRRKRNADRWSISYPGGETDEQFFARVGKFLSDANIAAISARANIIIVGHKGVSRAITAHITGASYPEVAKLEHQSNEIYLLAPGKDLEVRKV
jgi:probable phosphoglycerate mutase